MEPCKYEKEIGALAENLANVRNDTSQILKILNGPEGVVTQTALNKQSIGRVWWWVGGISLAIIGVCGWIVRGAI